MTIYLTKGQYICFLQVLQRLLEFFKIFKRISPGSKYNEINHFYTFVNAFINTHEATISKTKNCKNRIMNNVNQLYNDYFDLYKKITTVQM